VFILNNIGITMLKRFIASSKCNATLGLSNCID